MFHQILRCVAAVTAPIAVAMVGGAAFAGGSGGSVRAASQNPCGGSLTRGIPARAVNAPSGREFADQIRGISDDEREARIQRQLAEGNIPEFLRRLVPVRLESQLPDGEPADVVVCAAPDYLAIGSDEDFLLMPMRLSTALSTAAAYGFTLPTPRIVDAIYAQASVHLLPQPLPAGDQMRSTDYSVHHNELVGVQREDLGVPLGALVAGDKKDLVLTNRLWNHLDRVAIYGWHLATDRPIQPLSTVHGWRYADYSHGARLISTQIFINGLPRSIYSVMQDRRLAPALSDEGVISNVLGLVQNLNTRAKAAIAAVVGDLAHASPPL